MQTQYILQAKVESLEQLIGTYENTHPDQITKK